MLSRLSSFSGGGLVAGACVALGQRRWVSNMLEDTALPTGYLPAFSFDIDGVLALGHTPLPEAREAFKILYEPDGSRPRFPCVFLTNGGGCLESEKAAELQEWLGVRVLPEQVVLSHTPIRAIAPSFRNRPVLVAGRGKVLSVAKSYGFEKVATTAQLGAALASQGCTPLSRYTVAHKCGSCKAESEVSLLPPDEAAAVARGEPCPVRDLGYGTPGRPFEAIFVMIDPVDWARDIQLICDVIMSHGQPVPTQGGVIEPRRPIPVIFSNPDVLWASGFHMPRFGQGAFAIALESVYREVTGNPLPSTLFLGKPNPVAYRSAEDALLKQARDLFGLEAKVDEGAAAQEQPSSARGFAASGGAAAAAAAQQRCASSVSAGSSQARVRAVGAEAESEGEVEVESSSAAGGRGAGGERERGGEAHEAGWSVLEAAHPRRALPFSQILHVGDNPAADVLGALAAGDPWRSALVRTGVFRGRDPDPSMLGGRRPTMVVDNVLDAVKAGLHRARSSVWHSMR